MGRLASLGVLTLALLLPVSSAIGEAATGPRRPAQCPLRHAQVLTADTQALVYQVTRQQGDERYISMRACAYRGKRTFVLEEYEQTGTYSSGLFVRKPTLDGSMLAYELFQPNTDRYGDSTEPPDWRIEVLSLLTGRKLHSLPTSTSPPGGVGNGEATAIVLKGDGSVAWIAVDDWHPYLPGPNQYQVWAADKSGSRLLASGADIAPSSLALAGSTLYWTQAGKAASSTLN